MRAQRALGPSQLDVASTMSELALVLAVLQLFDHRIRLDRLLTMDESEVRREGAIMERATFDAVIAAARPHWTD